MIKRYKLRVMIKSSTYKNMGINKNMHAAYGSCMRDLVQHKQWNRIEVQVIDGLLSTEGAFAGKPIPVSK